MINIFQGDSCAYVIEPIYGDEQFMLSEGDKVYFTVKRHAWRSLPVLIERILTSANYRETDEGQQLLLELTPEDTRHLPTGRYKFDCVLELSNGERYTFIQPDDFIISATVSNQN